MTQGHFRSKSPIVASLVLAVLGALIEPGVADAARQRSTVCNRFVAPDADGTGDGLSTATPWTLAQANSPDADGIVICLMSGVYEITGTDVGIDPDRTLTQNSQRITYQSAPGAVAVLTFASVGAGTNTCIRLAKDYYTVSDLICRGSDNGEQEGPTTEPYRVQRGAVIESGADRNVITRNLFHFVDDAGVHVEGSGAQLNQVLDNDISHVGCNAYNQNCSAVAIGVGVRLGAGASQNSVGANRIRDVGQAGIRLENPTGSLSVTENVVSGNHIANAWKAAIEVEEVSSAAPTRNNVIEDNEITESSSYVRAGVEQVPNVTADDHRGIVIRAPSNIIRFNRITSGAADGLAVQTSASWPLASANRIYNNTVVQSVLPGLSLDRDGGAAGSLAATVVTNNSLIGNTTAGTGLQPPPTGAPPSATQLWIPGLSLADFVGSAIRNNLLLEDKVDIASPREVFRIDALTGCKTIADQPSGCADPSVTIQGNIEQGDPLELGAHLTTVAAGGCTGGPSVTVTDGSFFSDGIVSLGVAGDAIRINGHPTAVTVTSVNGNVLGLAQVPASCAPGGSVSLVYTGTTPAVGATRGE